MLKACSCKSASVIVGWVSVVSFHSEGWAAEYEGMLVYGFGTHEQGWSVRSVVNRWILI